MKSIIEWTPSVVGSLLRQHSLYMGRSIHANILRKNPWWSQDIYVQNHLLILYTKCHKIDCAQNLFDKMSQRNTISWTVLVSGYHQSRRGDKALELFCLMLSENSATSSPNQFTYASVIAACTKEERMRQGMQLHAHALQRGFVSHVSVSNVLITLYMTFGWISEAELIFQELPKPDQVSWNSVVSGLSQNGLSQAALQWFQRMRESEEAVTSFALSTAITSCLEDEEEGKRLHALSAKMGLNFENFTGCAMIRMYSRFKNMEDAVKVFDELGLKDVASWNSMIEGYGGSDEAERGLQVFGDFLLVGMAADDITVTAVLGIASKLVMLEYGKQVHSLCVKIGLDRKIRIQNSMIDMYAKCGSLEDGLKAFSFMEERSIISWTVMMAGLAHHGRATEVIELFEEMKREGLKPNKITYTCVLSACNHGGLVDIGKSVLSSMEIEPETDHLVCMVHMLLGGGRFTEAKEFIDKSPSEHTELLWQAFLVGCKNLGEWERGLEVAEKIMKTGLPTDSLTLVVLSSVFAATGRWEEAERLRAEMKERKMKKQPGCSWIEVDNGILVFGMNNN